MKLKNNIIKYSWLKKEKLTEKILKEKNNYECSICLEIIKKNEDINILKCGHIFHYKCMESLVDHHLSNCPNCRCDLKTGKKQSINQNQSIFNEISEYFIPIYDSDEDYDDYEEPFFL